MRQPLCSPGGKQRQTILALEYLENTLGDRPVNNCGNTLAWLLWRQEEQAAVKAQIMKQLIFPSEVEALKDGYIFQGEKSFQMEWNYRNKGTG